MKKSIDLLKQWHIEDEKTDSFQSITPLNDVNGLFSIKKVSVDLERDQSEFIVNLQKECINNFPIDEKGSGRYFFKAGKAILELFIYIENNRMSIEPYLLYNDDEIGNDLQRILHKEYIIFCLLKKWRLQ
ncbi:hypothetical protein AAGG74_14670 [Bacillus mexicanus]|uniref:hypothetical protein n=1 Tax=Bacillus mexicanus TaxID=2834415 RepID=UPI003D232773